MPQWIRPGSRASIACCAMALLCCLDACSSGSGGSVTVVIPPPPPPAAIEFDDEIIYFAFTDRFANGDTGNDDGDLSRAGDAGDPANPIGWHGGDFAGIGQKISAGYFRRMGFTAIWISPVLFQVPSPGTGGGVNANFLATGYHGYIADVFDRIEPHFGSVQELKDLVALAHAADLKIIIDVVVNHAGPGAAIVNQMPGWFRTGSECGADDISTCLFGLPDFKQEIPAVTAFLLDYVRWLHDEFGFDGIRMDTMKHVGDAFWSDFFASGSGGDPSVVWTMGEVFSNDVNQIAHFLDTVGSPSVLDFPLREAILSAIARGGSLTALARVFSNDNLYSDPTRLATFIDNHDVPRFATESEALFGARIADERLDMALSLVYAARGVPVVYYGTEIAMRGEGDPFDRPIGRSNREDMDFARLATSSFDERLADLAAARAAYPSIRRGDQETLYDPAAASNCQPADSGLSPTADFGDALFVRGAFEGWSEPPPAAHAFVNQGNKIYLAMLEIDAGTWEYKVAAADWSPEFANVNVTTRIDVPITLSPASGPGNNGTLSLASAACYAFELSAANPSNPVLTIRDAGTATHVDDVFSFQRSLTDEKSVIVVLNNSNQVIDLGTLPAGGINVSGIFLDGQIIQEITGLDHSVSVSGGRLTGPVPALSVRSFAEP